MVEDAVVAKRIKSLGNYFGVQFLLDCMEVAWRNFASLIEIRLNVG